MDISKYAKTRYLGGADMAGRQETVSIRDVTVEVLGGQSKPVLYFVEREEGLPLNLTNTRTLMAAYTAETKAWVGKPITLFGTTTQLHGQMVPAIRVAIPATPPSAPTEPQTRHPQAGVPAGGVAESASTIDW